MSFKPISTQEEFDAAVRERIKQETAKYADYDALKNKAANLERQLADANQTISGHTQTIADLTAAKKNAEAVNLRTKAALAHGLPVELADRITGKTEAEMNADAEKLAKFLPSAPVPPPSASAPLASTESAGAANASDAALLSLAAQL